MNEEEREHHIEELKGTEDDGDIKVMTTECICDLRGVSYG